MDEEAIVELVNERAAIFEYDAGMSRPEAEKRAFYEIKNKYGIMEMPQPCVVMLREAVNKLLGGE